LIGIEANEAALAHTRQDLDAIVAGRENRL